MLAALRVATYNPSMLDNEDSTMHSQEGTPGELHDLEFMFTDPFVERVIAMASTYNTMFEESTPSSDEVMSALNDLSNEWGNLKGSHIKYTGFVQVKSFEDEDTMDRIFLDEIEVISEGFCAVKESTPQGYVQKIKHLLRVDIKDIHDFESYKGSTQMHAIGDVENAMLRIESASLDHAAKWLSLAYPDLINEIDSRVYNGTGYEDDALLSLRNIDFNSLADINDAYTRTCIQIYINNIVDIDKTAPYATSLEGYARLDRGESITHTIKSDKNLVHIHDINFQPSFYDENDDTQWSLSAFVAILPKDRTEDIQKVVVPVETIQSLISIRRTFYSSNT